MNRSLYFLALLLFSTQAHAVNLLDKDGWKVDMAGFVETNMIHDSTRSLGEVPGSASIDRPDATAGEVGRTQFSMRNSRLGFNVAAPEFDEWKSRGYLEMDFFGYDPSVPTSSTGTSNTEAAFYNNPTFRIRHAYLNAEHDGWQILSGQTWSLLGFQPYFFVPTAQDSPVAGELFGRTAQVRAMKTTGTEDGNQLQMAVAVLRPPQRDSSMPEVQAGIRLAMNERKGALTGGTSASDKPQSMSAALSGSYREIAIPKNTASPTGDLSRYPGYAFAADALLPVLASSDGKDVSNNLVIGGEFSVGKGYGDQFTSWTGGTATPLATGSAATTPEKNTGLDSGIGDYDPNGNFQLIKLRSFSAFMQYHLPASTGTWTSVGYNQLSSSNVDSLTVLSTGKTGNGKIPSDHVSVAYVNVMHNFSKQIRAGVEVASFRTTYQDDVHAHDNRYQVTTWFFF